MRIGHGWRSRYLASGVVLGALLAAALASPSSAASYGLEQTLYRFCAQSNCVDGANPSAGLIMDAAGNLYGTTKLGNNPNGYGNVGVVFELTPTSSGWAETVLYNFCSQGGGSCVDGSQPQAGLIMDTAGNLYGTTYSGGGVGNPGVVFELTPSGNGWKETVLYRFCAQADCADGRNPTAGLIMDAAGNLYGTTSYGGKASPLCTGGTGCGVAFELIPNQQKTAWTETVLYEFCSQSNCADGAIASQNPTAGLIMDGAGNLYGTTVNGGTIVANICNDGCGVVFELTPNQQKTAWTQTVLYGFCSQFDCADGSQPTAGLIMDAAGNLYGTTSNGGDENDGTVFELMPSQQNTTWTETVLHSFGSVAGDGTHPYASLIMDRAGNIYGTTFGNGIGGGAKVFELLPDGGGWTERALYAFCSQTNCADGGYVEAGLIMDAAGDLYGTGYQGGNQGKGVVFELVPAPLYAKQADFNGDGKGDILWRYTDGTVAMWEMNGASVLAPVGGQIIPNTWEIAGTGDFDGDGKSDIVMQYVNGTTEVWLMNGSARTSLYDLYPDSSWSVVGTGDLNGDGKSDILIQNSSGQTAVWFTGASGLNNVGAALAPGWKI
ncbi:MAG: VCBS repeat-containing protein, partial [Alphaproteobacteria bacterium]|nr:VCBS repeat-containing protein [Alphaproteobacteria bacterium]